MRELLEKVISGELGEVELPIAAINDIEKELRDLGVSTMSVDRDSNGWQYDFWYKYKFNGEVTFMLSGSLFYGDYKFMKFIEDEE